MTIYFGDKIIVQVIDYRLTNICTQMAHSHAYFNSNWPLFVEPCITIWHYMFKLSQGTYPMFCDIFCCLKIPKLCMLPVTRIAYGSPLNSMMIKVPSHLDWLGNL